jgi:hypothetical protein
MKTENVRNVEEGSWMSIVVAFLVAVVIATLWGAVVQTQFNLAGLASIGAEIPLGLRAQSTLTDIFGGFSPTYAGYVVAPSLLVAFAVAAWVAGRWPGAPAFWFALGGFLAVLLAIPLVNYLSPVALLIGASRDWLCTILMALGGTAAGLWFAAYSGGGWERRQRRTFDVEREERAVVSR